MLKGEEFKLLAGDNKQWALAVTLVVVFRPSAAAAPLVCVGPNIDGALRGLLNHPSALPATAICEPGGIAAEGRGQSRPEKVACLL